MSFTKKSLMCGLLVFMSGHSVLAQNTQKNLPRYPVNPFAGGKPFFIRQTEHPIGGMISPQGRDDHYAYFRAPGTFGLFKEPLEPGIVTLHYQNSSSYRHLYICTYSTPLQKDIGCKTQSYTKGDINLYLAHPHQWREPIAIRSSVDEKVCNKIVPVTRNEKNYPCLLIGPADPERRVVSVLIMAENRTTGIVHLEGLGQKINLSTTLEARVISLPPSQGKDTIHITLQNIQPKSDICIFKTLPSEPPALSCFDSEYTSKKLNLKLVVTHPPTQPQPQPPLYPRRLVLITASEKQPNEQACIESNFSLCIAVSYFEASASGLPPPEN